MASERQIANFLYNTFGYGQLDNLLKGVKPHQKTTREFMEGTILGTFGRRASPACDVRQSQGILVPAWRRPAFRAPHIFSASQLEEEIQRGKNYLRRIDERDILGPEIIARQFFLSSYTAFVGFTANNVKQRLQDIHQQEFPQAAFEWAIRGRYQGYIKDDEFYLFSEGSTARSGGKLFFASFNLSPGIVDDINRIAGQYTAMTCKS